VTEQHVVITGLGAISPIGNTVSAMWERMKAGLAGISRITSFDPSALVTQFAGEVKNLIRGSTLI
jgi:3-oxoacyl-[acyl-carrier-protein] synthase II